MPAARRTVCRSSFVSLRRFGLLDHFLYAGEIARCHVGRRKQVAHECGDVAGEEPLGELADHRVLDIRLGDGGAIYVLPLARAAVHHASALQPRDERGDGRLSETSLRIERLPDLGNAGFAALPEQAEDSDLEFGEGLTLGHCWSPE